MKGGFDLYGTYYPDANDAMNAEMAQCAAIDARSAHKTAEDNKRKIKELERKIQELEDAKNINK